MSTTLPPYDALLLISFGGPERAEDVMPFLENVTRGRDVPRERLEQVAEHYHHLGGKSPINEQNRALIAALEADFAAHGVHLPIYFGNRNWHPFLPDTVRQMRDDGVRRALGFITSAYSSYSGCRQYRENIDAARAQVEGAPEIEPLRRFFNHPGFIEASVARVGDALAALPAELRAGAVIIYTAHSIPLSMAKTSDYELQLGANARLVSERLGHPHFRVCYQSRSGPPQVPWLEPDILDQLRELHAAGTRAVVIAPIGFVSDHVEVIFDLDEEARELCHSLGVTMVRAATVGVHPRFVQGIRELVLERTAGAPVLSVGPLPPRPFQCAPDCCPAPVRPVRPVRP
jgi:protoporphyrin/coproporphyrin ferrochelatase